MITPSVDKHGLRRSEPSNSHFIRTEAPSELPERPDCKQTVMPAADPPTPATEATPPTTASTSIKEDEIIDKATFEQILEMDDGDDDEFSRAIVTGFLEQAIETFEKMDGALKERDLVRLSDLGHFLKGSSATLGLIKMRDYCETIQNLGCIKGDTGTKTIDAISKALSEMKEEYKKADEYFKKFYAEGDAAYGRTLFC